MKRWKPVLAMFLCVLLLVSCATPVADHREPVDLKPSISMLYDSRPNDRDITIRDINTLEDITYNSAQYLKAWQLWETYARSLESYMNKLGALELYSL